jgi:hypothetical protein
MRTHTQAMHISFTALLAAVGCGVVLGEILLSVMGER